MTGGKQGARGFDRFRLREVRVAAGMTQRAVARDLDVSESVIAHWESGAQRPTVERVAALARALGVRPADLMTHEHEAGSRSLRQLREAAGLSQLGLAEKAGLTRTKYSSLERGEVASLSREDARRLSRALRVATDTVLAAHVVARAALVDGHT